MPTPTPEEVIASGEAVLNAWGDVVDQFFGWWSGSATGGPNGDGRYPFTSREGVTVLVPCIDKLVAELSN